MEKSGVFGNRYGPWALVAGGSEGLGAAFAEEIAGQGLNMLLVARRPGPLEQTASRLRSLTGVEIRTASVDLGTAAGLDEVARVVKDLDIGLLVHNAASSYEGPYFRTGLAK